MGSFKEKYEKARKQIVKEFSLKNANAAPKLVKISVNAGTGDRLKDKGLQEKMIAEFAAIAGQKPKVQPAKISVAGFSIREGNPIGLTATLRRDKMLSFLEKLISVVLPRLRDFRGVSDKSFDVHGNYSIGFSEHTVFPESDIGKFDKPFGMELTIVTNTKDKEQSKRLLELLGMPFSDKEKKNG